MSKPLVIGSDNEPYGAGPRVENGYFSHTERDAEIRRLDNVIGELVTRAYIQEERRLAECEAREALKAELREVQERLAKVQSILVQQAVINEQQGKAIRALEARLAVAERVTLPHTPMGARR